ncbi:serine/threonine protein kinase [Archangium violaceum]|uniref:serine/threonine-protein kinase n=1 Tax=Archangium violaceum TaxID=83451 RepID=UPI00193B711C|nr:serine/threonine-protein kinase [Archangium violaceum]QRK06582.1 serine/threonine protein kinase [Archangium violaceum]
MLVRRVAIGAMSEVYEGRHETLGHPVAVKVLFPEWNAHEKVVARFLNEARALQSLRHARIVTAFTYGTLPEGPPFMILEWLPVDLHQLLSRTGGPLPPGAAVRISAQLADALTALHERGIVHRDLKPANVLLAREELPSLEVKLADLGLAKVPPGGAEDHPDGGAGPGPAPVSTGSSAMLGTWDYMAPEQWIESRRVDPKADVYALGVLLFQLVTGRLPFIAEQQKDLMYLHLMEPPALELLEGQVPVTLRDLVAGMLGKKPAQRPTMREVMERLVV